MSLPDITLLPALARLLEIDMNTLFSFHEALTEQEVTSFVNTLYARAMAGEIADAFAEAQKKLRDYPHDVPLLYTCATMLSAALTLHPDEAAEHSAWRAAITDWLTRASEEGDDTFRTAARYCAKADTPLDLCGLSLGGILALAYTLEHPEKVRSLVLIGTPHKVPKAAFAVQNAAFRVFPAQVFRTMAFDKADTFALGDSMKDLDFSAQVAQIHCPTLILCGEKDRANLASARFFAAHIPGAECDVIPGVGHIVNEEAPEALAARLETFYAALR